MPRIARKYLSTSFFHVLVQGINKSYIFDERQDITKYLEIIDKYKQEYKIKIIAYCIMNNHAHLLINSEEINALSVFMHKVNTTYAIYFNKRHNRVGYVFRDRYKSEGIYTEEHLYYCIEYIHNNPVKAGICKSQKEYEFSSARELNQNKKVEEKCNTNFLEIEENTAEKLKELIRGFLIEKGVTKEELRKNREKLKELLEVLKLENKISFRKIEKELNIGRETLRKLLK